MWSSSSGHEHEKVGHMNPIVLYYTIDLHIYGHEAQKGNVFEI